MKEGFASVLLLLGQCQVNRTLSPQNPGSAMWPLDLLNTCESQPHVGKRKSPIRESASKGQKDHRWALERGGLSTGQ